MPAHSVPALSVPEIARQQALEAWAAAGLAEQMTVHVVALKPLLARVYEDKLRDPQPNRAAADAITQSLQRGRRHWSRDDFAAWYEQNTLHPDGAAFSSQQQQTAPRPSSPRPGKPGNRPGNSPRHWNSPRGIGLATPSATPLPTAAASTPATQPQPFQQPLVPTPPPRQPSDRPTGDATYSAREEYSFQPSPDGSVCSETYGSSPSASGSSVTSLASTSSAQGRRSDSDSREMASREMVSRLFERPTASRGAERGTERGGERGYFRAGSLAGKPYGAERRRLEAEARLEAEEAETSESMGMDERMRRLHEAEARAAAALEQRIADAAAWAARAAAAMRAEAARAAEEQRTKYPDAAAAADRLYADAADAAAEVLEARYEREARQEAVQQEAEAAAAEHAAAAAEKELLALEARLQREATERSAARRAALEAAEAHVQQLRREAEMAAAAKLGVVYEPLVSARSERAILDEALRAQSGAPLDADARKQEATGADADTDAPLTKRPPSPHVVWERLRVTMWKAEKTGEEWLQEQLERGL